MNANRRQTTSSRLPSPWLIIVAALVLLGAITLLQWALNLVGAFLRVSLVIVIIVVLVSWIYSTVARR